MRANKVFVSARGYYRKAVTTVEAKVKTTENGRRYLEITRRQMLAAARRCCYSGGDFPVLERLPYYGEWQEHPDGSWIAYEDVIYKM